MASLYKLYKINTPIRPVVSYVNAPAFKICKYQNNLLKNIFVPTFSITNSFELIASLQDVKIGNSFKLITFDIKDLFPSIPLADLNIIKSKLIESNFVETSQRTQIKIILEPILYVKGN